MSIERIPFDEPNPWLEWLWAAEQAVCKHEHMESDSCIGPESGSEDFWCSRCGKAEHIVWY